MKKRTKIIIGVALGVGVLAGAAGVAGVLDDVIIAAEKLVGIEVEEVSTGFVAPEGATQVTGMVLTAYGNEITLQLAADSSSSTQSGMGEGMIEGEMPEGMTEGGMSDRTGVSGEGMTEGEMPEGMTEGEMPEGMSEGEMPEGMTEGASESGMSSQGGMSAQGGMSSQGGTGADTSASAAMPSDVTDSAASTESSTTSSMPEMSGDSAMGGEMSGGMSGDSAMSGEMGEMSGGMGNDMMGGMDAGTTTSVSLALSDETQLFVIPTGTIVEYYGFEMTFSQIEAEQYITITLSAEGTILYVEVLG